MPSPGAEDWYRLYLKKRSKKFSTQKSSRSLLISTLPHQCQTVTLPGPTSDKEVKNPKHPEINPFPPYPHSPPWPDSAPLSQPLGEDSSPQRLHLVISDDPKSEAVSSLFVNTYRTECNRILGSKTVNIEMCVIS